MKRADDCVLCGGCSEETWKIEREEPVRMEKFLEWGTWRENPVPDMTNPLPSPSTPSIPDCLANQIGSLFEFCQQVEGSSGDRSPVGAARLPVEAALFQLR
mmetsp:Transcript_3495/g.5065  ORF Transcript_3495/g.5065 Transcript_3495/m.5065 type:complete len:101 (+) Transcript_3495:620-922(+)